MKKKAFTLAEILIAIGVVGVSAALTIPTLVSGYQKQVYASTLATAVSNFENAMTTMIMKEGVDNLLETNAWVDCSKSLYNGSSDAKIQKFIANIGKTLPIESYIKTALSYKYLNPAKTSSKIAAGGVRLIAKNGIEYIVYLSGNPVKEKSEMEALNAGYNYTKHAALVYIDVNGEAGPNIYGRDLFRYDLGDDGHLYPFHSREYANYAAGGGYSDVETKCKTDKDGSYCAAYLLENGYKMDY